MKNQHLINFLNQQLANHFVMYVKLHRYHWFIKGHHFFSLYELFQQMYEETAVYVEQLAERILAIHGKPLATMTKYVKEASITEANADDEEFEVMQRLRSDYKQMADEIRRKGFELAASALDKPTEDLLIALTTRYEKYVWMLSAWEIDNKASP